MAKKIALGFSTLLVAALVGFFAIPAALGFEAEGPPELRVGDRASESIEVVLNRNSETPIESSEQSADRDGRPVERPENLVGLWGTTEDSVAGYRVFKDFIGASEFEAVGRTSSVRGNLEINGTTVTEAEFDVNLTTVRSDDSRRDAQFQGPILNTAIFPLATFTLTSPIELTSDALDGSEIAVAATGELTLKGVTNDVAVALTARLVGAEVQVAGSIDISFEDFGIEPPSTPAIVVRDTGVVEFSLFFEMESGS